MTIAVTIRSLLLLGFDDSSALLYETSFDKPNERLLLSLLHFLISIIEGKGDLCDGDEDAPSSYAALSKQCLPYYDTKSKNKLKKVITDYLYQLAEKHMSASNSSSSGGGTGSKALQLKDINASIFSLCKGHKVWSLLRKLSNLALDARIEELMNLHGGSDSAAESDENAFAYSTSVYFSDKYDHEGVSGAEGEDDSAESKSIQDKLTQHVITQCSSFRREAAMLVCQQEQYVEYSKELAARLKTASKSIDHFRKIIAVMGGDAEVREVLSDAGRLRRTQVLRQLKEAQAFFLG